MNIGGMDCGCDSRREIMFESGNGLVPLIGLIAITAVVLIIARKVK